MMYLEVLSNRGTSFFVGWFGKREIRSLVYLGERKSAKIGQKWLDLIRTKVVSYSVLTCTVIVVGENRKFGIFSEMWLLNVFVC